MSIMHNKTNLNCLWRIFYSKKSQYIKFLLTDVVGDEWCCIIYYKIIALNVIVLVRFLDYFSVCVALLFVYLLTSTPQDDRDNFLSLALEGYKRCLVIGDKYDVRVVCTFYFSPLFFRVNWNHY